MIDIRYETGDGLVHTEHDVTQQRTEVIRTCWLERRVIRFAGARCFIEHAEAIFDGPSVTLFVKVSAPLGGSKMIVFTSAEDMIEALKNEPPDLCPLT